MALACARVGQTDTVRKPVKQTIAVNLAAAGREVSVSSTTICIQGSKKMSAASLGLVVTGTGIGI